jgi:hypothetical protein
MRRHLVSRIALASVLALGSVSAAGAGPVDAVVGSVGATAVSASDIALARAMGLFGFTPSEEVIRSADVDRYAGGLVAALEAGRLGIGPTRTEVNDAWAALEIEMGGPAAMRAWLEATTIDVAWARRAFEAHLRWQSWQMLHEGLTQARGAGETPKPESDLVVRNLIPPHQTIAVPIAMPRRATP